ncbi:MAG: hypothetical protein R3E73_08460 [Porticoccaceae bacterium]
MPSTPERGSGQTIGQIVAVIEKGVGTIDLRAAIVALAGEVTVFCAVSGVFIELLGKLGFAL